MLICYEAMGHSGGQYVALEAFSTAVQYSRRDIKASWILGSSLFGEEVKFYGAYGRPASKTHREFARRLYLLIEEMLAKGLIKNHPISVLEGGLEGLVSGIERIRRGKVRATKLVYPLVDVQN
jgi:aspyridone synthetase trans-acting enoyl reductase